MPDPSPRWRSGRPDFIRSLPRAGAARMPTISRSSPSQSVSPVTTERKRTARWVDGRSNRGRQTAHISNDEPRHRRGRRPHPEQRRLFRDSRGARATGGAIPTANLAIGRIAVDRGQRLCPDRQSLHAGKGLRVAIAKWTVCRLAARAPDMWLDPTWDLAIGNRGVPADVVGTARRAEKGRNAMPGSGSLPRAGRGKSPITHTRRAPAGSNKPE